MQAPQDNLTVLTLACAQQRHQRYACPQGTPMPAARAASAALTASGADDSSITASNTSAGGDDGVSTSPRHRSIRSNPKEKPQAGTAVRPPSARTRSSYRPPPHNWSAP